MLGMRAAALKSFHHGAFTHQILHADVHKAQPLRTRLMDFWPRRLHLLELRPVQCCMQSVAIGIECSGGVARFVMPDFWQLLLLRTNMQRG